MKHLIFLFMLMMVSASYAGEIAKYQAGVETAFSLQNWSERSEQFTESDLRPPPGKISFGVARIDGPRGLELKTNLSFLDSKTRFFYLAPMLSYQFSLVQINGGLEGMLNSFSEDSKYKKSPFDSSMFGAFIGASINLLTIDFHASFYIRKFSETELTGNEGVKTKMAHQYDYVQKYGALWKNKNFGLEGELARFKYGETTIASREFFYRIKKNTLYRASFGAGILMGDFELWGRFYQFKKPDDELAIYHQAASFVPDYTLSKRSLFLELLWNF